MPASATVKLLDLREQRFQNALLRASCSVATISDSFLVFVFLVFVLKNLATRDTNRVFDLAKTLPPGGRRYPKASYSVLWRSTLAAAPMEVPAGFVFSMNRN